MTDIIAKNNRAKSRRERPAHLLKPGSRAAWERGCKCYTLLRLATDPKDQHQAHCPLRQMETQQIEADH